MKLSDDLKKWRSDRPDEWTMDRFIKKAQALEYKWINVKDRLPKEYELVLAADRSNRYWLDRILPNKLRPDRSGFGKNPDYWMPLPELPGIEEE